MAEAGYRKLTVYHRSLELVEKVYRFTSTLPDTERYGLASQMQRAPTSIPMNIAEGYGRRTRGDYIRGLSIARGSVYEIEAQIDVASRLGYIAADAAGEIASCADELRRMLTSMILKLERS